MISNCRLMNLFVHKHFLTHKHNTNKNFSAPSKLMYALKQNQGRTLTETS